MLGSSSTDGAEGSQQYPLIQWPIFTRNSVAGFACALTDCIDSTVTRIDEIIPKDGKPFRFLYEYDFGDGWEHEVLFEGCLLAENGTRDPLCLEGERACPPEDVGGVGGYAEYLEALADPKHEQHQDFMEWRGLFDADLFDAAKATKAMRRGLPNWRLE